MRSLFKELIKGNLPGRGEKGKKGEKEEKDKFSIEKGEKYYFLYKNGNPSKEQLIAFGINEAKSEKFEERCECMFENFGYYFNKETRRWNK